MTIAAFLLIAAFLSIAAWRPPGCWLWARNRAPAPLFPARRLNDDAGGREFDGAVQAIGAQLVVGAGVQSVGEAAPQQIYAEAVGPRRLGPCPDARLAPGQRQLALRQ